MSQGEGQGSKQERGQSLLNVITSYWIVIAISLGLLGVVIGETLAEASIASIFHHSLRDLGIAGLTLGLLGLIYERSLRKHFLEEAQVLLKRTMDDKYKVLEQVDNAGITAIYENRPNHRISEFRDAQSSIRILQTYSGDFLDNSTLGRALAIAAEKAEVHILLLKPTSDHVAFRREDLGGRRDIKQRIIDDIRNLKALCETSETINNNIEVRLYDATPVIALYGYDDTNIVGTFWQGKVANNGPQLEVSRGEGAYSELVMKHWDKLWDIESPKTIDAKETEWWKDEPADQ